MPFESLQLNYPLGSHLLMALMAKLLHVEPHVVFNIFLPVIGVMTTAVVFTLAHIACDNRRLALFAASAYGLWAGLGSIGYYLWGGLPNALGMLFLLAIIQLLIEPPFRGKRPILCLLCSALILTHHHVMITAIVIFAVMLITALLWKERTLLAQLLGMALGAGILTSFYTIPYLLKVSGLAMTSALNFTEDEARLLTYPGGIGYLFFACAVLGIAWYAIRRITRHASTTAAIHRLIPLTCLTLLGLYILCAHAYPILAQRRFGHPYVAFTPSRFITDMVPFLAIYCGFFLAGIVARFQWPLPVVMVVLLAASATQLPLWRQLRDASSLPEGYQRAGTWIRQNTPPDTVVFTMQPWAPYLTWRRTLMPPIPASEPGYKIADFPQWRSHLDDIMAGHAPDDPAMPVVRIVPAPASDAIVLWRDGASGIAVIRLTSGSRPQLNQ
jgi:hypothetical protein